MGGMLVPMIADLRWRGVSARHLTTLNVVGGAYCSIIKQLGVRSGLLRMGVCRFSGRPVGTATVSQHRLQRVRAAADISNILERR